MEFCLGVLVGSMLATAVWLPLKFRKPDTRLEDAWEAALRVAQDRGPRR